MFIRSFKLLRKERKKDKSVHKYQKKNILKTVSLHGSSWLPAASGFYIKDVTENRSGQINSECVEMCSLLRLN